MTRYLINKCPFVSLNFKTLEEVWFGKPIKYDHLCFFSYVAYVYVR